MVCHNTTSSRRGQQREFNLSRKLAALAGATGAIAAGSEAQAVTYAPTPGVAAAQGIPGFSFVDSTNVTLGTLRPPAQATLGDGVVGWDVDGVGGADFDLLNRLTGTSHFAWLIAKTGAAFLKARPSSSFYLANLAGGSPVNPGATFWKNSSSFMTQGKASTFDAIKQNPLFTEDVAGQFGFRFTNGSDLYYGWASLTYTVTGDGRGFQISEAYYQTTPSTGINVGQVPVAVPEPSSMTLLAAGAAGVAAWRARRKKQPAGDESCTRFS